MSKKYNLIREVEISENFPKGDGKTPRYKKGEVHYMHKDIASKLQKAGVTKSVKPYERDKAVELEKKAVASAKKKQKELLEQ